MSLTMEIAGILQSVFPETPAGFEKVMQLQGKVYREVEARKTLRFEETNKGYFAKLHFGIGLGEILKNLSMLKKPVMGARQEYDAINHLTKHHVGTMTLAGFGEFGKRSFVITEELAGYESLYTLFSESDKPSFALRLKLIKATADIIKRMHDSGMNHRDCYMVHVYFKLKSETDPELALIDLHRSQIRKVIPRRWRIKDLAGLHFSSMDFGLSKRDLFRFMKAYSAKSMRDILKDTLWKEVDDKARALYKKEALKRAEGK